MQPQTFFRTVGNTTLALYFIVTSIVFLYTVFRIRVPIPYSFFRYSYGMMAPYQSYDATNTDLHAEGLTPKGEWQTINLRPYYPVIFGEMSARQIFAMYARGRMSTVQEAKRREQYAHTLALLEEREGRTYERIMLTWQRWPTSPGGYFFLKEPAFTEETLLGEWETPLKSNAQDVFSTQYE